MTQHRFDQAIALIDAANREDPNRETCGGEDWPKELLYSHRMSDMLERYAPDADDAMKLAVRAQHIRRWKSPRSDYPMDRKGYHQWRAALNQFHADTVAGLLTKAGYDEAFITRVAQTVGKKSLKANPDTQLLEDIAALVFLEHYLLDLASIPSTTNRNGSISFVKSGTRCQPRLGNLYWMCILRCRMRWLGWLGKR